MFSESDSTALYILSAVARLPCGAEREGRPLSIIFFATDGMDSHVWEVPNTGTFVSDFALLVDAGAAYRLYARLCSGEIVTFPGSFDLTILRERLGGNKSE